MAERAGSHVQPCSRWWRCVSSCSTSHASLQITATKVDVYLAHVEFSSRKGEVAASRAAFCYVYFFFFSSVMTEIKTWVLREEQILLFIQCRKTTCCNHFLTSPLWTSLPALTTDVGGCSSWSTTIQNRMWASHSPFSLTLHLLYSGANWSSWSARTSFTNPYIHIYPHAIQANSAVIAFILGRYIPFSASSIHSETLLYLLYWWNCP